MCISDPHIGGQLICLVSPEVEELNLFLFEVEESDRFASTQEIKKSDFVSTEGRSARGVHGDCEVHGVRGVPRILPTTAGSSFTERGNQEKPGKPGLAPPGLPGFPSSSWLFQVP